LIVVSKKTKVEILSAFLVFDAVCQKKLKVFDNQIRLYKYFMYFTGLVKLNLKRDLHVLVKK